MSANRKATSSPRKGTTPPSQNDTVRVTGDEILKWSATGSNLYAWRTRLSLKARAELPLTFQVTEDSEYDLKTGDPVPLTEFLEDLYLRGYGDTAQRAFIEERAAAEKLRAKMLQECPKHFGFVTLKCSPESMQRLQQDNRYDSARRRNDINSLWRIIEKTHSTGSQARPASQLTIVRDSFARCRQGASESSLDFMRRLMDKRDEAQRSYLEEMKERHERWNNANGDADVVNGVGNTLNENARAWLKKYVALLLVEVLPFATEQELADHYLMKLDPARFSTLIQKLENDELLGAGNRPTNIAEAYTVASNWRVPAGAGRTSTANVMNVVLADTAFTSSDGDEEPEGVPALLAQKANKFEGECYHCKKPGHKKAECRTYARLVKQQEAEKPSATAAGTGASPVAPASTTAPQLLTAVYGLNAMASVYDSFYALLGKATTTKEDNTTAPCGLKYVDRTILAAAAKDMAIDKWHLVLDCGSALAIFMNEMLLQRTFEGSTVKIVSVTGSSAEVSTWGETEHYKDVLFYPDSIANLVSFKSLEQTAKKVEVILGVECVVHFKDGSKHHYRKRKHGLYTLDVRDLIDSGQVTLRRKSEHTTTEEVVTGAVAADIDDDSHEALVGPKTVRQLEGEFTKQQVSRARLAREFQDRMNMSSRDMIWSAQHAMNCPYRGEDVERADYIYGPSVRRMKGNAKWATVPKIRTEKVLIPDVDRTMELRCDLYFVCRGIPFLLVCVAPIGIVEVFHLQNQKAPLLAKYINVMRARCIARGFFCEKMYSDNASNFEGTETLISPLLHVAAGSGDHESIAERQIQTVKTGLRTQISPRAIPFSIDLKILIGLSKCVTLQMASRPSNVREDRTPPLHYWLGRKVDIAKDWRVRPLAYVQSTEPISAQLKGTVTQQRTAGCLALYPAFNETCGWVMLSLRTWEYTTRSTFAEVPMPDYVSDYIDDRIHQRKAGVCEECSDPTTEQYEEGTDLNVLDEEAREVALEKGEEYSPPNVITQDDAEATVVADQIAAEIDDNTGEEQIHDTPRQERIHRDALGTPLPMQNRHALRGARRSAPSTPSDAGAETGLGPDVEATKLSSEFELANEAGDETDEDVSPPKKPGGDATPDDTHSISAGARMVWRHSLLANSSTPLISPFEKLVTQLGLDYTDCDATKKYASCPTMAYHEGVKHFGEKAAREATRLELTQMLNKDVFTAKHISELTAEERKEIIPSMLNLKDKYSASDVFEKLKGRLCAGGHRQNREKYTPEETAAPTAALTSILMVAALAAHKNLDVCTVDVPGAYLNSTLEKTVYMRLRKELAAMYVSIQPDTAKYLLKDGTMVVQLKRALYGCIESARLWYEHISKVLTSHGYTSCPHDPCVFRKIQNGEVVVTVVIYVDDLLVASVDVSHREELVKTLRKEYGNLTERYGDKHDYLGMAFDFSENQCVKVSMPKTTNEILRDHPVEGTSDTPAGNDLYTVGLSEPASESEQKELYSVAYKLLHVAKRTRPDILPATQYLTTRVQKPNKDDIKKSKRVLRYLNGTRELGIRIQCHKPLAIHAYIDASYAIHDDMRSQTGCVITMGAGHVYVSSSKQKINVKSSTESEFVGVSDKASQVIWCREVLAWLLNQNNPPAAIIHEDNQATIHMSRHNRPMSEQSRHISIRRYFWTDRVKKERSKCCTAPRTA